MQPINYDFKFLIKGSPDQDEKGKNDSTKLY